jgi:hypothetical protein
MQTRRSAPPRCSKKRSTRIERDSKRIGATPIRINAVTLMELREPPHPQRHELLPVVRYAVTRRIEGSTPDYWDYATLLELAVLANHRENAADAIGNALIVMREKWKAKRPPTTSAPSPKPASAAAKTCNGSSNS